MILDKNQFSNLLNHSPNHPKVFSFMYALSCLPVQILSLFCPADLYIYLRLCSLFSVKWLLNLFQRLAFQVMLFCSYIRQSDSYHMALVMFKSVVCRPWISLQACYCFWCQRKMLFGRFKSLFNYFLLYFRLLWNDPNSLPCEMLYCKWNCGKILILPSTRCMD